MLAADLQRSAERAVNWANDRLAHDGSFIGATGVVLAYYKAPLAFSLAGRNPEAARLVRYIGSTFFKNGDFNGAANDPSSGGGANYRNAWLTWGMETFGALQFAYPAADLLESVQNGRSGGIAFNNARVEADREVDWGSTCCAIIGLLAQGRRDSAIRAGRFIQQLIADQPSPGKRLYLRRNAAGVLLYESKQVDNANTVIEIGAPGQIYWHLGIALAAFGKLCMVTSDPSWLESANIVLEWVAGCHDEVYSAVTNAKIAWGAGTVFAVSRDGRYAQLCERVANWLLEVQTPEGAWLRPQFSTIAAQPLPVSLDTSLERAVYMFELAKIFA
jgi:hypothetical protein